MAWSMSATGLDELGSMLGKLADGAEDVASYSLYEGAAVMAGAFAGAAGSIRTEPFTHKKAKRLPSPEEKAAVAGKTGIAKFNKNGTEVDTIVGLAKNAGYVQLGNKTKPVAVIARSINSGTSFMAKQPVFRKAASTAGGASEQAIINKAEQMLSEIIGS